MEMAEETKDSKADAAEPTEEEKLEALPDMEVATQRFLCGTPDEVGADKAAAKAKLLEAVRRDNMATYYESACEQLGWEPDASLLESMRAANAAELEAIAARQADAQENLGDIEVHQAIFARCALYTRDGDTEKAFAEYESWNTPYDGTGVDHSEPFSGIGSVWLPELQLSPWPSEMLFLRLQPLKKFQLSTLSTSCCLLQIAELANVRH